jgi:hypothetical protein
MNMPPLPYLKRIPALAEMDLEEAYTNAQAWERRARLAFGASLGVQLAHLNSRQRRGFLDGLLSREGIAAQPA